MNSLDKRKKKKKKKPIHRVFNSVRAAQSLFGRFLCRHLVKAASKATTITTTAKKSLKK